MLISKERVVGLASERRALSPARKAAIAVLLLIPFAIYLALPTYDRAQPELLGVPFFWWYQTVMLAVAAVLFFVAAYLWESGSR